jgi:hypothetical protein
MWVGALINPIPALGVSLEIRPVIYRHQAGTITVNNITMHHTTQQDTTRDSKRITTWRAHAFNHNARSLRIRARIITLADTAREWCNAHQKIRGACMFIGCLLSLPLPIESEGWCWKSRRPPQAILSAPTAGAALFVASEGIKSSIGHMDGSKPLW